MPYELKLGIIIGIAILVVIVAIIGLIFINKRKNKSNQDYCELLEAIGGKENISEVILNGSRVSVNFIDKSLINKENIKKNGVETIVMANKKLTLVIGKNSESVYKYLNDSTK